MAVYTIQGPDGKTYEVEGPAGATAEQLGAFVSQQPTKAKPAQTVYDPTEGMSGTENFLAGAGKAMVDLGRGAKQVLGFDNQAEIDASSQRDKALMKTGAEQLETSPGALQQLYPPCSYPARIRLLALGCLAL